MYRCLGIQENDSIEFLNYYTVRQIAEFMDVIINQDMNIYVNNKLADMDTIVYENFAIIWTMEELQLSDRDIYGSGSGKSPSFVNSACMAASTTASLLLS